jgi:hypothetical protein
MQRTRLALFATKAQVRCVERPIAFGQQRLNPVDVRARIAIAGSCFAWRERIKPSNAARFSRRSMAQDFFDVSGLTFFTAVISTGSGGM